MNVFENIKEKVLMKDVLEHYGIYPVRGNNIYCCFAHNDKKPSANIVKGCERFHCFSCNWSGDIFDVVAYFEECDLKKAVKIVDNKFGLNILKQLSHKEKLQIAKLQREREKQQREQLAWQRFEVEVMSEIAKEIKLWGIIEKTCHITKGEYKKGEWELSNLFFYSLKRQEWLNWLYDVICGFKTRTNEFDCVYGTDKLQILKKIKNNEIKI